ncbi:DUF4260 domain-containing protein [Paracoccus litorisediminis]|jgi:hypothetical protein|uniref:DUF4260 family protein n=1 Tax=Paracoccus litorisediminis TaxID=2006130 RepID=A0A844HJ48_9RHOB|nr:DUF4260 domain-containing protein [Paracoccus litorisediminis]MTH58245.1 DUF4260 family protein [Paracoccus litorisediminis]
MNAKLWQQAEGAGMALGGVMVAGFSSVGWPWWVWLLALAAPDLGMLGYLAGRRVGAAVYNAAHLYAVPFLLMMLGVAAGHVGLIAAGGLWLAHIGADRALGYGLKLPSGFRDTHLGRIGSD